MELQKDLFWYQTLAINYQPRKVNPTTAVNSIEPNELFIYQSTASLVNIQQCESSINFLQLQYFRCDDDFLELKQCVYQWKRLSLLCLFSRIMKTA